MTSAPSRIGDTHAVRRTILGLVAMASLLVAASRCVSPSQGQSLKLQPHEFDQIVAGGHRAGPLNASVVILVYFHYSCGFCQSFEVTLRELRQRYPREVAVVYKPLVEGSGPLSGVYQALECAADQNRAIDFHFAVVARTGAALWRRGWLRIADSLGVGGSRDFDECLKKRTHAWRLDDQFAEAKSLGVLGTPTSYVNGWKVTGAATLETMDQLVRMLIADQPIESPILEAGS